MQKRQPVYLIGLTGNIACGKSTVLRLLAERGASVIDADQVTRDLQQPGQPVYNQIVASFGPEILAAPAGPIDRKQLAAIVFSDPTALQRLEAIVHPAVREHNATWLAALQRNPHPPAVAVLDAIKLLESGWKAQCDAIWVVTCTPEQQLQRLIATRGMSEAEARMRIDAQPPQAEKVAQADVVIDNSGALDATIQQVEAAWAQVMSARR